MRESLTLNVAKISESLRGLPFSARVELVSTPIIKIEKLSFIGSMSFVRSVEAFRSLHYHKSYLLRVLFY